MASTTPTAADEDPFDTLLSLEDEYYTEGYDLGVADGSRAGRIEGRVFGLEKGFEKFAAMGHLAGRCAVWEARLPAAAAAAAPSQDVNVGAETGSEVTTEPEGVQATTLALPPLHANPRLQKHISTLFALTEAASLSTENNEDSVSDFDDRLKRAEGKVKVIEKLIGEGALTLQLPPAATTSGADGAVSRAPRRQVRVRREQVGGESSMEDFNIRHARS